MENRYQPSGLVLGDLPGDAVARRHCSEAELADLDAMPGRLPLLTQAEIVDRGLAIVSSHLEAQHNAVNLVDETDTKEVIGRALAAEYLLRQTRIRLADELERRRTGIAPRAKRMN